MRDHTGYSGSAMATTFGPRPLQWAALVVCGVIVLSCRTGTSSSSGSKAEPPPGHATTDPSFLETAGVNEVGQQHYDNAASYLQDGGPGLALVEIEMAIATAPDHRAFRELRERIAAEATAVAVPEKDALAEAARADAARAAQAAAALATPVPPARANGPGWISVSAADFGDAWPLTISSGILRCEKVLIPGLLGGSISVVVFDAAGKRYAVNGVAKSRRAGVPIDEIWAANPALPGAQKNIGPLIDRGLRLCG